MGEFARYDKILLFLPFVYDSAKVLYISVTANLFDKLLSLFINSFCICGDVGIEGNSGSDGKGEWSEMVRACVEEG